MKYLEKEHYWDINIKNNDGEDAYDKYKYFEKELNHIQSDYAYDAYEIREYLDELYKKNKFEEIQKELKELKDKLKIKDEEISKIKDDLDNKNDILKKILTKL